MIPKRCASVAPRGLPHAVAISALALILGFSACQPRAETGSLSPGLAENGGLVLPDGFEAIVVADSVGPARHLVIAANGDIYVKLRRVGEDGGIVALRDTNGDGRADIIQPFGIYPREGNYETAIRIHNGYLYFTSNLHVYRYPMVPGQLLPDTSRLEIVQIDDHAHGVHSHQAKPIAFDGRGRMFVAFGAPSDACQEPDRTPGLMAQDPCPELEDHAGIWVFDENRLNQTTADGTLYATGLRSVVAMEWNPVDNELYALQHGRDYLFRQWPEYYNRWDSALLPAEEFVRATQGANFGWPFCYYDQLREQKLLNPEYGGDGKIVGRCGEFDDPIIGFPGHFAPNGLLFYDADQFPEHYRHGAFIAFHGSTIRNPYSQAGYFVAFVPYRNGWQRDRWEAFANGFAGVDPIVNTSNAAHRPMGLAVGPDGSLYISDTVKGKIWRIRYTGDRNRFGPAQLARMEREKRTANNIKDPDPVADNLEREVALGGEALYLTYCAACHARDGEGAPPRFPPIADTEWVSGDKERLISIVLEGMSGPIMVRGELYNAAMPPHGFLSDQEVAEILTYIRQNFRNDASAVTPEEVSRVRNR
jgi:glucose/arabinose dehydrogenase/mono/diheme cytochrome c family protein